MSELEENDTMETTAKNVMAGHQSYMTKLYRETETLMLSYDNKEKIIDNNKKLKTAFENFSFIMN